MERRELLRAALALVVSGCGARTKPEPSAEPRVVSTSPSMTEIVFALGRGARLVGRTDFCDYPKEAAAVESIGGFATPSLEKIVSLAPSLVCGERGPAGPDLPDALAQRGVATFFPVMDTIAQIRGAIEELGAHLDAATEATKVNAALDAALADVERRVAERARPKVILLFDWRPLVAAGPDTFPDAVLRLAGGVNPAQGTGKYPKLSVEGLLGIDPDVVIDGSAGAYSESPAELARSIPGLEALRAAKAGKLFKLEGSAALRPGPRIGEGAAQIARMLHPEAFG